MVTSQLQDKYPKISLVFQATMGPTCRCAVSSGLCYIGDTGIKAILRYCKTCFWVILFQHQHTCNFKLKRMSWNQFLVQLIYQFLKTGVNMCHFVHWPSMATVSIISISAPSIMIALLEATSLTSLSNRPRIKLPEVLLIIWSTWLASYQKSSSPRYSAQIVNRPIKGVLVFNALFLCLNQANRALMDPWMPLPIITPCHSLSCLNL